jgi:squalene-hopene/tetraprenyl-beta-curcumene cyclase
MQQWFMGMQNKNGGYSAFESNNNPAIINKLEFDGKGMFDPPCEDVTGHALELFAMILQSPHRNELDPDLLDRIKRASILAIKYLASTQHKIIGGWFGRVSPTWVPRKLRSSVISYVY